MLDPSPFAAVPAPFVLAAASWAVGRRLLRSLAAAPADAALAVALGLAVLAHASFALAAAGALGRPALAALGAVALLAGGRSWGEGLAALRARVTARVAAAALVAALPFVLLALFPPWEFDETTYHLPFARAFATTGAMPFLADLRYPAFPPAAELLAAGMLLLFGETATHAVALVATLATAALLADGALHGSGGAGGALAAAILLGSPMVVHLSGTGYVEPLLALFAAGAVVAVERWRAGGSVGWLTVAGLLAGSAAATKYLGLFFPPALLGVVVWTQVCGERRASPALRAPLVLAVAAAAALAPTYLRLLALTGNPVFPFSPELFGPSPWAWQDGVLPRRGGLRLLTFPLDVYFRRGLVGDMPPYSPLLLLGLPLLAVAAWRRPAARPWLAVAALYVAVMPLQARFLMPVVPILAAAIGGELAALLPSRRTARLAAATVFLPGWLYAAHRLVLQGPPPVTAEARERFLSSRLPGYALVRALEREGGPASALYAFRAERLRAHASIRVLGEWNGPARYATVEAEGGDPVRLHAALRRAGADHLLVLDRDADALPALRRPAAERLFRPAHRDADGAIFALRDGGSP